jgi:hypothetical protein
MCNCYHRNGKEIGYLQAVIIAPEVDQFLVTKSVFQQGPDTLTFQTLLNYVLTYLPTYLYTYFLTPRRRVPLENLTSYQLVKNFPT